jgi:predicted nucleotidyltransferase
MSFMDTLRLRAAMVREWRRWAPSLARAVKEVLPTAEVYVIGSAVRAEASGGSDVDILIVSPDLPEGALQRAMIKVKIEEVAGLPYYHPFEMHLVTHNEAKRYLAMAGQEKERLIP